MADQFRLEWGVKQSQNFQFVVIDEAYNEYLPPEQRRPAIDWSSRERRRISQYVFRESCATPQEGWDD